MGAVYLVENTELQRDEALKVPHFGSEDNANVRERFLREARAAAKLDHPNLCPIYDVGVIDEIYFLTMRLLPGKPLSAYTGRPHPPREAVKVVMKLAQALEHAHAKGVIHRDLKPGNIIVCPGTGPTVLDFGLAKEIRHQDHKLTQTGATLGTPAYMPPEQVKGELDRMGPASDVYSLGVILFELLTGRVPFVGTVGEVMGKVVFTEAPLPSEVLPGMSPEVDEVCHEAMAKEPEDRHPSMKDFGAALARLLPTLAAKNEAGKPNQPVNSRNTPDVFDMPTLPPEQAPGSNHLLREMLPAIPLVPIPDETEPEPPKPLTLRRKRRTADAVSPAAPRRGALIVWLCLALVAGGVSVAALFWLGGKGRDRAANDSGKTRDQGQRAKVGPITFDRNRNAKDKNDTRKYGDSKDPAVTADAGPDSEETTKALPADFTNQIGMRLVRIPAGTFTMGSPREEVGRSPDEDQHEVTVSTFHLGVYEVTQKQYTMVMGKNPSWHSRAGNERGKVRGIDTDDFPVECVSWYDAVAFCNKLTAIDMKKPVGWVYRLPREAEWEYACRGGAPSYQLFHFGNSLSFREANFKGSSPFGGAEKGNYLERPCKVGSYQPNRLGLCDMHGNVWEWCLDWYGNGYYSMSPKKDPSGPLSGSMRVMRGGCWGDVAQRCRSAYRGGSNTPDTCYGNLGFRVALVPAGK
jgi:formylglycine-generating enzyme required for sulfatase activity/serine/threonine protein kinase